NEDLLASRWHGKVEPDMIEGADGLRALSAGTLILPYARPGTTIVRDVATLEGNPRVSIVIPLFHQVELTTKCLESLAEHTADGTFEVILVDNGSTDATPELLARLDGNVKIVRNEKNLGFATACNQGAALASTEHLLFLNNDIEAKAGWLPPLLDLMDADPSIGIAGSKLLFPSGEVQHAGVAILERPSGAFPLGAFHVHYGVDADCVEVSTPTRYQAVTGACLLVRRKLFEEVGGFDTYFWNGCEDVDFCLKVGARGWKVVYEPKSVLVHHESKSGPQRFSRTKTNEDLLASRWHGKVEPDMIEGADGLRALSAGTLILPYARPGEADASDEAAAAADVTAPDELASIIILTRNGLADTRICLDSIERHTPEPHEVIVVDNGSTDGTGEYLRDRQKSHGNLRVVTNRENRGFAAGNNLGFAVAHGGRIVLLNNDTAVTDGWLSGLARVLARHPECGLVGPMSNYVSGPQLVANVPYRALEDMERFAIEWACDHTGSRACARIVGFCWLMRREVLDAIGGLDERFGTGNFEDDDYCLR
ncbi:glycosyltransferase family 2 protein, partial [bacterium]|nr:glycosyltransferase family 2 protein [bacterium]